MNSPKGKELLALIRRGDYAHPGEEEAINLVFKHRKRDAGCRILDAGCGRGGTAAYLHEQGFGQLTGIDIDPVSIESAVKSFPYVRFFCKDILACSDLKYIAGEFDVIYMITSLYAIANQASALNELRELTQPEGELLVFDYTSPSGKFTPFSTHHQESKWYPIPVSTAADFFNDGGWQITGMKDLSAEFAGWYTNLVKRIEMSKDDIISQGDEEWYNFIRSFYTELLNTIRSGKLGGALFSLKK